MARKALVVPLAVAALAIAPPGDAGWAFSSTGSGKVGSQTMPAGNTPSGSISINNVTVSWSASHLSGGQSIPGYVVKRYNALTNVLSTTLASCSGIVTATSCTENGVPTGTWRYTVTPAAGSWRGAESAQSAIVIVV
ncbi:MAG TPA: hypothetical protein VE753_00050 [Gaiellaceae bacterium]|nr:hypothetical protein [Gaiellaceae bacterium]